MRWIPVSQAASGMVLGEPVLDSQGRILARKGENLSEELLGLLRASGIGNVFAAETAAPDEVPRADQTAGGPAGAEMAAAVRKRLEVRFRRHQDNALMQTIRNLAENQLIQARLSTQTNQPPPRV
ncbi:MAG: hypothetical protein HYY23_19165 [Verrucomicrobia bacterium]|nr:hypothetical protein [Verrucomicrobiota bacterium]